MIKVFFDIFYLLLKPVNFYALGLVCPVFVKVVVNDKQGNDDVTHKKQGRYKKNSRGKTETPYLSYAF